MRLKKFAFLVLLLLGSAWLDDARAAAALAPAEDTVAAQDNDYLPAPSRASEESARASHLPPLGGVPFRVGAPTARAPSRQARPAVLCDPPLLYVLMSLQR
jgi:hypothetical protein